MRESGEEDSEMVSGCQRAAEGMPDGPLDPSYPGNLSEMQECRWRGRREVDTGWDVVELGGTDKSGNP